MNFSGGRSGEPISIRITSMPSFCKAEILFASDAKKYGLNDEILSDGLKIDCILLNINGHYLRISFFL